MLPLEEPSVVVTFREDRPLAECAPLALASVPKLFTAPSGVRKV
jgi:hypothetical protein